MIYGKLADIHGRRPVLMIGITLFLIGSLLCGFAWSLPSLIVFRALQGIGAGAIQPLTITIVGDLYKLEERGRVQGLAAGVWAASAVIGPLAGALIVDTLDWAWVFWMNIPIGVLALFGFHTFLRESPPQRCVAIDYAGTALFIVAVVTLLLILTELDAGMPILTCLALACVLSAALFFRAERKSAEPIISLGLWAQRPIATSVAANFFAGVALIGITTVLPLYVQGVLGQSALVTGTALTALIIGWPMSTFLARRFYKAVGIRNTLQGGGLILPAGALVLLFLNPVAHPAVAALGAFLMGFGMGLLSLTSIAVVQDSVEWSLRGTATASVMFARTLGNTLGATVLGSIINLGIDRFGAGSLSAMIHRSLSEPSGLAGLASAPELRSVFDRSLHWAFAGIVVAATCAFIAALLMPAGRCSALQTES
jgi:MFS family permease